MFVLCALCSKDVRQKPRQSRKRSKDGKSTKRKQEKEFTKQNPDGGGNMGLLELFAIR